jgi:hypothetical protein
VKRPKPGRQLLIFQALRLGLSTPSSEPFLDAFTKLRQKKGTLVPFEPK